MVDPDHTDPKYAVLWLVTVVTVLGLLFWFQHARAADAPPVKCSEIRAALEQFGERLVLATARERGFSDEQIERIRRACGVRPEKK